MSSTRDRIIETTCDLLETQGYYATGLNQIIAESGAPKGSLYYYFPQGKEELTVAAIHRTGQIVTERIQQGLAQHDDPAIAISEFIRNIAYHVERSGFRSGGPLMTVAMETANSSERINLACAQAYGSLRNAFQQKLLQSGYEESHASRLATFIMATIEGGIILSRTNHTGDPLRTIATELEQLLKLQHPTS